jgi:hypothetical protein
MADGRARCPGFIPQSRGKRIPKGRKVVTPARFSGGVARQRHGRGIRRHRYFVPRNRSVVHKSPEITTGSPGGCSGPQPAESMAEEPGIRDDRGWRDCVRWDDSLGKKRLSSRAHMTYGRAVRAPSSQESRGARSGWRADKCG